MRGPSTLSACLTVASTLAGSQNWGRAISIASKREKRFTKSSVWCCSSKHTYWGLGYVNNTYPEELQNDLDELNDLPGVDHFLFAMDAFGFYWPLSDRTPAGGVVNGSADVYEATDIEFEMTLNALCVDMHSCGARRSLWAYRHGHWRNEEGGEFRQ